MSRKNVTKWSKFLFKLTFGERSKKKAKMENLTLWQYTITVTRKRKEYGMSTLDVSNVNWRII